jgi:hypothetical protein
MTCYAGGTTDVTVVTEWLPYDHLLNTQVIMQILQVIDDKRDFMGQAPYAWAHAGTSPSLDALAEIDWDNNEWPPLRVIAACMSQARTVLGLAIANEWITDGIRSRWSDASTIADMLPSFDSNAQKHTWLEWVTKMRETIDAMDEIESDAWYSASVTISFFPSYADRAVRTNYINPSDLRTDLVSGKTHTKVWVAGTDEDAGHLASLSDWQSEITGSGAPVVQSLWQPVHETIEWPGLSATTIFDSGSYWSEYANANTSSEFLETTVTYTARLLTDAIFSGTLIVPEIVSAGTVEYDLYPDSSAGDLSLTVDTLPVTIPANTYTFSAGLCATTFGATETTLTLTPNPFPDLPYYKAADGYYPGFTCATNHQGAVIAQPDDLVFEGCVDADGRIHL